MSRKPFIAVCGSLAILAALIIILVSWARSTKPAHPLPPATPADAAASEPLGIDVEPVRLERLQTFVAATAKVMAPEDAVVKVSPRLQGRVDAVYVDIGEHVRASQVLATLDSADAVNAQNAAAQAQDRLRLAKSALERQQRLYRLGTPDVTQAAATLEQAKQQEVFAKSALEQQQEQARIGGFTQKPLEDARSALVTARSTLAQAQADLALAAKERDRTATLNTAGVVADRDLAAAQNAFDKAKVSVDADQDQAALAQETVQREQKAFKTNLYANQQLATAQNTYEQAALGVDAAQKSLRLAQAQVRRDLQQAQSDFQAAQLDASNSQRLLRLQGIAGNGTTVRVTAPISGVVMERNVNPGQVVDTSTLTPWQMFTLEDLSTLVAEAQVYEKDLSALRLGEPVEITVDAYPSKRFTGRVSLIGSAVNPATGTIEVRAKIDNRDGLLKDGLFARARIFTASARMAATVPEVAIRHTGVDRSAGYVFLARAGGKFQRREVVLGTLQDGRREIRSGLAPGDRVVTNGALLLEQ